MKKILLLAAVFVMIASMVHAQGHVAIYLDGTGFTECNIASDVGLLTINVVHTLHPGATAVQYKIQNNGTTLIYLADVNFFALVIGNSQAGIAVSYGACLPGPILVQNILYNGIGTSPACSNLAVVPDPAAPSGFVEAVDCTATKVFPTAGIMVMKDDGSCPCMLWDRVEETTWGKLKSLYE